MKNAIDPQPDLRRLDLPIYPKAFITAARLNRERDRVFVAMPFAAPHSEQLWRILRGVADIHGLNVRRVDERLEPAPIISDILDEMERAEIIVVDLAGLNANVVYELGIAHARCSSVILLSPKEQVLPFDLAAIRCIFYDLSTRESQVELAERLGKTLVALRSVGPPTIIESPMVRTETICTDLGMLAELSDQELSGECVWFSGLLSAFAINEDEPFPPEESPYLAALLKEREALLSLARRGCPIRCIITPPATPVVVRRIETMIHRLKRLMRFLESDDPALDCTSFVVSPFRQKNLYIIGHVSCIEGYKKDVYRGYGLNLRQTDMNAIQSNISVYETLFDHLEGQTLLEFHAQAKDRKTAVRLATIRCLKRALEVSQTSQSSQTIDKKPVTRGGRTRGSGLRRGERRT